MQYSSEFQAQRKQKLFQAVKSVCNRFTYFLSDEAPRLEKWFAGAGYIEKVEIKITNQPHQFVKNIGLANSKTYRGSVADSERRVTVLLGDLEGIWKPAVFSTDRVQIVVLEQGSSVYLLVLIPDNTQVTLNASYILE